MKNTKAGVEAWFRGGLNKFKNSDEYSADNAGASIIFDIPKGTALCSQKVYVDFQDTKTSPPTPNDGAAFTIQVIRAGLLG